MSRYKVVITDREYENIDSEIAILNDVDAQVEAYQYKDANSILSVAKDADAIIVQFAKMPKEIINNLDKCKIIAKYATGFDGIDLEAATEKGIYVCNVPDYCRDEVSSHGVALLMEMARRVGKYNDWTHSGNWSSMEGKQHNLRNQIIGVISFGRIAKSFIEKIKPLCDNIWVSDMEDYADDIRSFGATPKTFEEIIEGADYISIHCPLLESTYHMFNKEVFKKMKNSAVVINVARGEIISEEDLVWAIENKEIGGAALDVLEEEPPRVDNPLFGYDNVIITPHTAWYSEESQRILQSTPAEEIVRVLNGEEPLNVVNKEVINKLKKE